MWASNSQLHALAERNDRRSGPGSLSERNVNAMVPSDAINDHTSTVSSADESDDSRFCRRSRPIRDLPDGGHDVPHPYPTCMFMQWLVELSIHERIVYGDDRERKRREAALLRDVQRDSEILGDSSPVTLEYSDLDIGASFNPEVEYLELQEPSLLLQCGPSSTSLPLRTRDPEPENTFGSATRRLDPEKQTIDGNRGPDASIRLRRSAAVGKPRISLCPPEPGDQEVRFVSSAMPEDTGDSSKTGQSQSSNLGGRYSKNLSPTSPGRSEKRAKSSPSNDGDGNGGRNPFRGNQAARSQTAEESKRFICYFCLRINKFKGFGNIRNLVEHLCGPHQMEKGYLTLADHEDHEAWRGLCMRCLSIFEDRDLHIRHDQEHKQNNDKHHKAREWSRRKYNAINVVFVERESPNVIAKDYSFIRESEIDPSEELPNTQQHGMSGMDGNSNKGGLSPPSAKGSLTGSSYSKSTASRGTKRKSLADCSLRRPGSQQTLVESSTSLRCSSGSDLPPFASADTLRTGRPGVGVRKRLDDDRRGSGLDPGNSQQAFCSPEPPSTPSHPDRSLWPVADDGSLASSVLQTPTHSTNPCWDGCSNGGSNQYVRMTDVELNHTGAE